MDRTKTAINGPVAKAFSFWGFRFEVLSLQLVVSMIASSPRRNTLPPEAHHLTLLRNLRLRRAWRIMPNFTDIVVKEGIKSTAWVLKGSAEESRGSELKVLHFGPCQLGFRSSYSWSVLPTYTATTRSGAFASRSVYLLCF